MLKLRQFLFFVHFASVTDVFSVHQCGYNEVYDICPPQDPPDCLSDSDADSTPCTPGCRCLDNYLRNEYGQCVPPDQLECYGENEVSGCENNCFPQTCHSIGTTHHCLVQNSVCKPECRCKENYFRNLVGDCISKEDCLQCTGPNEYFSAVGPCDKFCDNLDQPNPTTTKNVDVVCINMCRCEEGYARNSNNTCVPISECSPQIKCEGVNEVSSCHNTCPQTCESIGKIHSCPLQRTVCEPECRCKTNYYRNKIGECISREDCLKCTGPNEYFSSNGKCDKFCASLEQGVETSSPIANRVCGNICHCEEGYARDFNNTCVPISKCPKLNCVGPNEVSGCHIPCPPQTCQSIGGIALPCIPPPINCQPECRCKDGYFRNKIGECISKENCLKCTGPNEYFSSADLCDKFCDSLHTENETSLSNIDVVCINMCHCDEGYVRDSNNDCVPTSTCPPQLNCVGENEVTDCHNTCPQTCESIGKAYSCPLQPADCEPQCRCKTNYFRNKIGECISKENCLKCTGPNEYFSSNGKCDSFCASLNQDNGSNATAIVHRVCGNTCHCVDGYARDFNNTCVPISTCPILECLGQNEVSGCDIPCPPQTCDYIIGGIAYPCVPPPINCQPECRCKDGYYRNKIEECVSKENCLKCTGPNEYFSTNGNCDSFCASLDQDNGPNTAIVHRVCGNTCHCEDGYARDFNNTCVLISKCPILECLGQNEVSGCYISCPPQTCSYIIGVIPLPCIPPPINCQPECRCKYGYYRNKIGECISKENCLKCTGPNEYFSTNGKCDNFCASLNQDNGSNTAIIQRVCGNTCHCEDGYARDFNNTCVPISKCPILECLGQNEVSGCYIPCPPQTCDYIIGGIAYPCVPPPINCQPECRCKDGFYRNKIGECVSKEDCFQCTGANEYFSPAGPCDKFCSTPGPEIQSNSPDRDVECINMCHCEKGYLRNSNNTCVTVSSCPPPQKCTGPNEYFSSNGGCDKFCAILDQDGASSSFDDRVCGTECHCVEGYARDFNNTCVPISQCPKLNCSRENEVSSCYVSCPPQTCESISTENVRGKCIPPPVKCLPECRCKNHYYRNKIGECISREDCLKCSGPNEYFSSNGACDKYCASFTPKDGSNSLSDNSRCGNICHCEEGYARDFNNTCVPISECLKLICTGENEVSGCRFPCPPQTCENIGKAIPCMPLPEECQPECRCKDNYFRNKIGECISEKDCLKCTGPNEYFSYNNTTDKICSTSTKPKQLNCATDDTARKLCHCEDGYARDSNSTCIPISQCPEDVNTILEEFEEGNVAFTQNFLYIAAKQNPGVSVIFSALSVLILLAQLALYATGPSLLQLLKLINLDSSTQIRSFMPNFLGTLNSEHNVTFNIVDNVYANIDYTYRQNFKTDSKHIFNAEVQNLDFCEKVESAETINNWVSKKTNNLITHLISPDMLDCDTVLVMIDAIYFKSDWKYKFDPKNTQKTKFIVDKNKNVTVNMMKQTANFRYAEINKPGVQVLIMPYKNGVFSIMVLLPKNKYGINDIISKINKRSFSLSKIINNTEYTTVNVKFPIISTTTTTDLKDLLMKINVTAIFDYKTSGLTNILSNPKPIKVTKAVQKATIIVSETGSEAAAASGVVATTYALPLPPVDSIEFNADHQFIYFLLYHDTPVFAGLYAGP